MSHEDYEVAKLTLNHGRFMHTAFMCQQTIEKAIKAVYTNLFDRVPPRKHDLLALCNDTGIYGDLTENWKETLARLSSLYIISRYPEDSDLNLQPFKKVEAQQLLDVSGEVLAWLETKMK